MPPFHDIAAALDWPRALALLEAAWLPAMAVWILLERRPPVSTIAWILGLAAMPLVGIPVYLFLGPRRLDRKKLRMAVARRTQRWRLEAWERAADAAPPYPESLMRLATRLGSAPPETATSLTLYAQGDDCFAAMEEAIRASRHHVHAEYYIFRPDRSGTRIRDALVERARAGVEVRLLVDAAGSATLGRRFAAPLIASGGQLARFNPVLLGRIRRPVPNFRTHRKILVCDGTVGFTGGVNVCDDHSRAASGDAAWRDTHLRVEGAAVHGLQLAFLENWAFATGLELGEPMPESLGRLARYFPPARPGEHWVQIIGSGPDQEVPAIEAFYFAAISGSRERVWLTTPYFVPGEALLAALTGAALRGVDVQLVLPRATDSPLVDAAGSTYHDQLLDAGARIHVYPPPMIHAKTCVVDREIAIVGTANLDPRSFHLNFEVLAAVYGGPALEELALLFERDRSRSRPRRAREGKAPLRRRLLASAARLLAPQL